MEGPNSKLRCFTMLRVRLEIWDAQLAADRTQFTATWRLTACVRQTRPDFQWHPFLEGGFPLESTTKHRVPFLPRETPWEVWD